MAEKITQIQIGADVRDIGLGAEAALELGSSVMEQIGQVAMGMTLNGTRLSVKTGEGLKVIVDSGVVLDTAWLFGTMKENPWLFVDRERFTTLLAPDMGTFAGQGLTYEDNKFTVPLGTGLKLNGNGQVIPDVAPNTGIVIDKYNGLALDTEIACRMLTQAGDGSVIRNGEGLCVHYGTGLTMQGNYLVPQVGMGLEILDDDGYPKKGISVRLGTAMAFGGTATAVGVDISELLNIIKNEAGYLSTLKNMLGLT